MPKHIKTMIKELSDVGISAPEGADRTMVSLIYTKHVEQAKQHCTSAEKKTDPVLDKTKEEVVAVVDESGNLDIVESSDEEKEVVSLLETEIDYTNISSQSEIMDLFDVSEMDNDGNVFIHGLRRVASLVIGPVINQDVSTSIIDSVGGNFGAASVAKISFLNKNISFGEIGSIISFADAADVIIGINAEDAYGIYPTALSVTRAEGRVLRKALRLGRCIAAEEAKDSTSGYGSINTSSDGDSMITDGQKHLIEIVHKRQEIKVNELGVSEDYEAENQNSLELMSKDDAKVYISFLNKKIKKKKTKKKGK